ncbi:hypothetical protein J4Q44_G00266980 [Coregonus suidteri]|uniref:Uncharacterized protein n=1 Tax=Coregonus suidteri TaxID=861788 RepID=A0AAN8QLM5_9TELE
MASLSLQTSYGSSEFSVVDTAVCGDRLTDKQGWAEREKSLEKYWNSDWSGSSDTLTSGYSRKLRTSRGRVVKGSQPAFHHEKRVTTPVEVGRRAETNWHSDFQQTGTQTTNKHTMC